MATTMAEYYTEELYDWDYVIASYLEEMEGFEHKLNEVIQRNSIPGIASKVEHEQDKLSQVSDKFHWLLRHMQQQEVALKPDSAFIDDELVNAEIKKQQDELRRVMQQTEKEYIEKKHECINFLSGIQKK